MDEAELRCRGHKTSLGSDHSQTQNESDSTGQSTGQTKDTRKKTVPRELTEDSRRVLANFFSAISIITGITVLFVIARYFVWYFEMLHENLLWFSNIKEVEREISFRTEQGLYYSFYKQLTSSADFFQGIQDLKVDNHTEYGNTINLLHRFNIYQEVFLSAAYRYFKVENYMAPIFFYTKSVFFLQSLLAIGVYVTAWLVGKSWLAGALAIMWFIGHKNDASRVDYSVPLRESFSLPFVFLQMAIITAYLQPRLSRPIQISLLVGMFITTTLYMVTWQFAQFIALVHVGVLYGLATLKQMPKSKVVKILVLHEVCLVFTYVLHYGNTMLLSSIVFTFIPVAIVSLALQKTAYNGILKNLKSCFIHGFFTLCSTFFLNRLLKLAIGDLSDQHIFKFVLGKLGLDDPRDFESRLYLCNKVFGFPEFETYYRLSESTLFPIYCFAVFVFLTRLVYRTLVVWEYRKTFDEQECQDTSGASHVAYHTVLAVCFTALGATTMRMKCFWVPHMCIMAAAGVSHPLIWAAVSPWFVKNNAVIRRVVCFVFIIFFLLKIIPFVNEQMENLNEFWDPDTVELMEWIRDKTPVTSVFAGSMQLLAGVKLCTGRPITNHPHFEDEKLRQRTVQIYQMYGRTPPDYVYNVLRKIGATHIVLEDSICLTPAENLCQLVDTMDLHNGHIPEFGKPSPGLVETDVPRFCDHIRNGDPSYTRLFKFLFSNKSFRVYKVLL